MADQGPADAIETVAQQVEMHGFKLVECKFIPQKKSMQIKVAIFHPRRPITHDDCTAVDRALGEIFDEAYPLGYHLEVGSPGVGRAISSPREFAVFQGQAVEFAWKHEPGQYLPAVLVSFDEQSEQIGLEQPDGTVLTEPLAMFNRVRLA